MQCCVSDWNFICPVEVPTFSLINSTRTELIQCSRKQQCSCLCFPMEKDSAIALSVTLLPATDGVLVFRPPVSRNGLKTGSVTSSCYKVNVKKTLLMVKWQRLVWHRHVAFKNYITSLGWIFISEILNCEGNILAK